MKKYFNYGKRILALLLMIIVVVTTDSSTLLTAFATNFAEENQNNEMNLFTEEELIPEEEISILVNGQNAAMNVEGFSALSIPTFYYNTTLDLRLSNGSGNSANYKYLNKNDFYNSLYDSTFSDYNKSTTLLPGNYYLVYIDSGEDQFYGMDMAPAFGIVIKPVSIAAPSDIAWSTDPLKDRVATWSAPTKDKEGKDLIPGTSYEYEVSLSKDNSLISTYKTNDTFYNFDSLIESNGYGEYTYSVKAVPLDENGGYLTSDASASSENYSYVDEIAPIILSYEIYAADETLFYATAKDNVGISDYAFINSEVAPDKDSAVWNTVTPDMTGADGVTKVVSGEIQTSGNYYFYVKDSSGNIVKSSNSIPATILMDESSNLRVLLGNSGTFTFITPISSGKVFDGYYANPLFLADSKVNSVNLSTALDAFSIDGNVASIPVGTDFLVYPKWKEQEYNLTLSSNKASDTMTYEGSLAGKGMQLSVAMNTIDYDSLTYTLEKKNADGSFYVVESKVADMADPFNCSFNKDYIKHVADSGVYKVVAHIAFDDGRNFEGESNELVVTIEPASLELTIDDATIYYKDAAPSEFAIKKTDSNGDSLVKGLLPGDTSIDDMIDSGRLSIGSFITNYDPSNPSNCSVGTYKIENNTSSPTSASDYTITFNDGTLTVLPKNVVGSNVALRFKEITKNEQGSDVTSYETTYSKIYTGLEIKPDVVCFDATNEEITAGIGMIDASDIASMEFTNNINVSTDENPAKATVTFTKNYTGKLEIDFTIVRSSCDVNIIMKNADGTNASANADGAFHYTFGEPALYPELDTNPTEKSIEYYYFSVVTEGVIPVFDKASGTKVVPKDAGTYAIYAYIPESANYTEIVSPYVLMKIDKRKITFTAASDSWPYDGKEHRNPNYTQTGTFAGADGIKDVKVTGVVKEMTSDEGVENVISYTLSPTTKAENYDITSVNGRLKITGIVLTTPSGFSFLSENPGWLSWTPLSIHDVDISYEIKLYRKDTNDLIDTYITEPNAEHYDLTEIIRSDSIANGPGEYAATIQSLPTSGSAKDNYMKSAISSYCSSLYTLKMNFSANKVNGMDGIEKIYVSGKPYENIESLYLLEGENYHIFAKYATGFWNGNVSVTALDAAPVSDYLKYTLYTESKDSMEFTFSVYAGYMDQGHEINVVFTPNDKAPEITKFVGENLLDSDGLNTSVQFSIEAKDDIGLLGYSLLKANSVDDVKKEVLADNYQMTSFANQSGNVYSSVVEVADEGTHYLVVFDTAHNYTIVSDKMAITVYEISFDKGKALDESDDIFNDVTMKKLYKIANTTIVLPSVKFEKTGYAFKDWKGDMTGVLYNDHANYSANASDLLRAEWSNEQYKYYVEYYVMDTNGNYPMTYTSKEEFNGGYNLTVASDSPAIQNMSAGFTLDTTKKNTVILGNPIYGEAPVVKVYYKRNQYHIKYQYKMPNDSEYIVLSDEEVAPLVVKDADDNIIGIPKTTYYFGEDLVLAAPMEKAGYTFSGWDFGDFDTSQITMPAKNLEASATFTAGAVNYDVVVYLQNIPTITDSDVANWNNENDYCEIPSNTYTKDTLDSKTYISSQGSHLTLGTSSAPEIDGFTCVAVVKSINAPNGTNPTVSDLSSTSMNGDVDATNHLYINYYYTRNKYTMTLNVWKDKRDVPGNKLYEKSWKFSYGRIFSTEQINALEKFGYDEDDTNNKWIENYMDAEKRKAGFESYMLADFTDYSTGARTTSMPYGDVTITKEYVEKTTASYEVQIYLEGLSSDGASGEYKAEPSYRIYYYDAIGKNIVVDKKNDGHTDDQTMSYLHYDELLKMLDNNSDSYTLDSTNPNNQLTTKLVDDEDSEASSKNILRIYMARNRMESLVTYYYQPDHSTKEIILQYTVSQVWGSSYTFNPGAYFYGNGAMPETVTQDGIIRINNSTSALLSKDFNAESCAISYDSYQYFVTGQTWSPTGRVLSVTDVSKPISTKMGQGTGSRVTKVNIYYTPVDDTKTFRMKVKTNAGGGSYVDVNPVVDNNEYDIQSIELQDGTDVTELYRGTAFNLYYANKREFYNGVTPVPPSDESLYNALSITKKTYDYSSATLKPEYTILTIKTNKGTGHYYLENGTADLYIANGLDSFYEGNRVSTNIESSDNDNGAKLGRGISESKLSSGYALTLETGYGIPLYGGASWTGFKDWTYSSNGYYYYQYKKDNQRVNLIVGSKSSSEYVEYGSKYNPLKDSYAQNAFNVDAGYRIVWYKDKDKTQPIQLDDEFTIIDTTTFYGNREKDLITNYDYVSYELSDRLQKNSSIVALSYTSKDGFKYITEEVLNGSVSFKTADESSVLAAKSLPYTSNLYQVVESTSTRSYINNEATPDADGNYPSVSYVAKKYSYYMNGELVLVKEENKSLSFSAVSLDYQDYSLDGLFYSESNTDNKTRGYCQKEPISLAAFFYCEVFEKTTIHPSSLDPTKIANTHSKNKYGTMIEENPVEKPGYTFDGWILTKADSDTELSETELKEIGYRLDTDTMKAYYSMPNYNLNLTAKWKASNSDYDIVTYYQKADQTYPTAFVQKLITLKNNPANVILKEFEIVENSSHINKSGYVISEFGSELAYAYSSGGYTYYFDASMATLDTKPDESTVISVPASALLGADKTVALKTEEAYKVDDYQPNDLFSIFAYSFTNKVTGIGNIPLNSASEFVVESGMSLANYYERSANYTVRSVGISLDSTAETASDSGIVVNGVINDVVYGEEVSLSATVASGYEFKGFYHASTLMNADYEEGISTTPNYLPTDAVSKIKADMIVHLPYIIEDNGDGTFTYTSKATVYGDADFIAVSDPKSFGDGFNDSVSIIPGNTDYTYGYDNNKNNYLTAKVTLPADEKDKVSIIGYQWYLVDGKTGTCSSDNAIPGATSSTFLIPTGRDAGTYYYQCVVTVKRTDNGREGRISATTAESIVVKKYGENPTDKRYAYVNSYDSTYDAAYHGISLHFGIYNEEEKIYEHTFEPKHFKIYYSNTNELKTWDDVVAGLSNGSVYGGALDSHDLPDEVLFKDVELVGDAIKTHNVYYYIRTEEKLLDPNYKDIFGSSFVRISPIILTLKRTGIPFIKQYDNQKEVLGDAFDQDVLSGDLYRLMNGETDGTKYFTMTASNGFQQSVYDAEKNNYVSSGVAEYNNKDVEYANAIEFSDLKIYYKNAVDGHAVKDINYNYRISSSPKPSVSARIKAYPLHLEWSDKTSFIYNGLLQAPTVHIHEKDKAPNADLDISTLGGQTNTGNYTANAGLVTLGKSYTEGDYSFDVSSEDFEITPCYITVAPKDETKQYNAMMQYLTNFTIEKSDDGSDKVENHTTKDILSDGSCVNLPSGQRVLLSSVKTDKGGKECGDYTIQVIKDSIKIYDSSNRDITYNYEIMEGTGTLTVTDGIIKITSVKANNKTYDGTTDAALKTKTVTLSDGTNAVVLDDVILSGVCASDEIFIDSSKITDVRFAYANVKDDETVTFVISPDALIGKDASNYTLDVSNSVSSTTANIEKAQIKVKVNSVNSIYGMTPNYGYTLTGFMGSDDASIVKGNPTYLLGDGLTATNYEVTAYKYSYTYDGGSKTATGTKIPVKDGGYIITLDTDDAGFVKGMTADNYNIIPDDSQVLTPAKLIVEKREISISGKDRSSIVPYSVITKEYDATTALNEYLIVNNDFTYKSASDMADEYVGEWNNATGLISGDIVDLSYSANYNNANVSLADKILATELSLKATNQGNNYKLKESSFEIPGRIKKKLLTLQADNLTITYGDSMPVYTASVSGYVVDDDGADENGTKKLTNGNGITLSCDYNTSIAANRNAGAYTISVSGNSLTNSNYTLKKSDDTYNFTDGLLTVKKKEVELSVEDVTIVYGKEAVPTSFTGTFTSWVSAYGDTTESVLGTSGNPGAMIDKIHYALDPLSDYPYKDEGYAIHVTTDSDLLADNYSFKTKDGTMNVAKQYLAISGITIKDRVYDGNTIAPIDISNPLDIKFTCYIVEKNHIDSHDYTIEELLNLSDKTTDELAVEINNNLVITGNYLDKTDGETVIKAKDVGNDKPVSLKIELKNGGYLDSRYVLIPSDATSSQLVSDYGLSGTAKATQSMATGNVSKRPITIQVYYSTNSEVENPEIKYGEDIQATGFKFRLKSGTFVAGEGIADTNLSISGEIVDGTGALYTKTSGAGKYFVRPNISGNSSKSNYDVTLMGATVEVKDQYAGLDVKPNQLNEPTPGWVEDKPGTVSFNSVSGIGDVEVSDYVINLYKMTDDTSNTSTLIKTETIHVTDVLKSKYDFDFATDIRSQGPGCYMASVQAIAKLDDIYNPINLDTGNKKNVLDSKSGSTERLFAANIEVSYASDSITTSAASIAKADAIVIANQGKSSYMHIAQMVEGLDISTKSDTEIILISGEHAAIMGEWYNEEGYNTGYTLKSDTPFSITQGGVSTTEISVSTQTGGNASFVPVDNSANGVIKASVSTSLTSSKPIEILMPLVKRSATLSGQIDSVRHTATYGYDQANSPEYKMLAVPADGDNLTSDDYIYTYEWRYKAIGAAEKNLLDKNDLYNQATNIVKTGLVTGKYLVSCKVKAKRKDNEEETAVITFEASRVGATAASMIIEKAVVDGTKVKAILKDSYDIEASEWMYGEKRLVPDLTTIGFGSIPGDIGTIHYYFTNDNTIPRSSWAEWTLSTYPENAGTYFVYAKVDANKNYETFETQNATEFNITSNKLGKLKNDRSKQLATVNLSMNPSDKAPYGNAVWPAVYEPKENEDSTTNYISAHYEAKLYKYNNDNNLDKSNVTEIKTYTEVSDSAITMSPAGLLSVNMTGELNAEGVYFYTVKAISNQKSNCADSDLVYSADFKVYENIGVKDANGNNLLTAQNKEKVTYTYNSRDITLYVTDTPGATYQWFKNGISLGASANESEYKVRKVADSGNYSCQISISGKTYDTSYVAITINPRQIQITSDSATKGYDGIPLIANCWWISSDSQSKTTGNAVSVSSETGKQTFDSATTVTDIATGDLVSGVKVTGTKTTITIDDFNNPKAESNTLNLDNVQIKDSYGNIVYSKSMESANTANYVLNGVEGDLKITRKEITIISSSDEKFYDTTELTKKSYTLKSGSVLASGDSIVDADITYPSTITNVLYKADGLSVDSIINEIGNIKIKNTSGIEVTDNYKILVENGLLCVKPKGEGEIHGNADFAIELKVNGVTAVNNIFDYTGSNISPEIIIKDTTIVNGGIAYTLVKDTDYEIVTGSDETKKNVTGYSINSYPSADYTIHIKLKNNFIGDLSVNWGIQDVNPPTGKITISSNVINKFFTSLIAGGSLDFDTIFDKDAAIVKIQAEDKEGESGIAQISYYVYEHVATTDKGLTISELEALPDGNWVSIENGNTFTMNPDKVFAVYEKIVDKAGHTVYLSSDGVVLDATAPTITGSGINLIDQAKYCKDVQFTVAEDYLLKVTDNGTEITPSASGIYTISVDKSKTATEQQKHIITAIDKAGNSTTYTIYQYSDHQYDEGTITTQKTDTVYEHKTYKCTCSQCDHEEVLVYPDGEIVWNYAYTYTDSHGGTQSGVVGKSDGQRSTKAKVKILRDGSLTGDEIVVSVNSFSGSQDEVGNGVYSFTTGLPYDDGHDHVYTYSYQVVPLKDDGVTETDEYDVEISNKVASLNYNPDLFEANWNVYVKGNGVTDNIVPSSVNVKILFATEISASDDQYAIVSQQVNNDGVSCNKGAALAGGGYQYSGSYLVWKYQTGKIPLESYYHRIQVTGCTINGHFYDLTSGNYKSAISDKMVFDMNLTPPREDHVMSYTFVIDEESVLPILFLDKNAYDAVDTIPYILKEAKSMPVTEEELKNAVPTRNGYTFKGWYDKATDGNLITKIDSLDKAKTLYAYWRINGEITDIDISSTEKVYDGTVITPPTVTSNNASGTYVLKYKKKGASDNTYTTELPKDAGEYTVMAMMNQDDAYTKAVATKDFVISKRPIVANVTALDKDYDGTKDAKIDVTSDTGVAGESLIIDHLSGLFAQSDVGNLIDVSLVTSGVIIKGKELTTNPNNYSVSYSTGQNANIHPRAIVVKAKDCNKHVGEKDPEKFLYDVINSVKEEKLKDVLIERNLGEDVGNYDILVTVDASKNTNYTITVEKGTFTILDHIYTGKPLFSWADDFETCTATFYCDFNDGNILEKPCKVTKEDTKDFVIYTATVENNNEIYTDKQYVSKTPYKGNGYDIRLVLRMELGIREITDDLLKKGLNSEPSILEVMQKVVIDNHKEYLKEKSVLYDVDIQISYDSGKTWSMINENNFPKDGIAVEIPYPEGTNKDKHDFFVVHMFARDFNGHSAGECEIPTVTKGDTRIKFILHGLSPILIAWKDIEEDDSITTNPLDVNTNVNLINPLMNNNVTNTNIPKTGDETPLTLIWTLFVMSFMGLIGTLGIYYINYRKKKNKI